MFIEPFLNGERRGWVEVICGAMFSGKTEELIRRLKRAKIANLETEIFKPVIDIRYNEKQIVSHDENSIPSIPVEHSQQLLQQARGMQVIGIDEAQFFDDGLPEVCDRLALDGCRVIVAGLDMDYQGKPFGQIPALLAKAEYITKLHAICVRCGHIASYSYRKTAGTHTDIVLLGEKDHYEPRCRKCFFEQR